MYWQVFSRSLVACLFGAIASGASATWSILLVDLKTGEIAVGSATCLTSFDLRAGTPVIIPGVGAATAQSFVDVTGQNRTRIRDLLAAGATADEILLSLEGFDPSHQTRQYGIVSAAGEAGIFSGTGAGGWAGGVVGVLPGAGITGGDIVYAIQGNVLTGSTVVSEALNAIESSQGDLSTMLMVGMEAARAQGGDGRCSCATGNPTGCGEPPDSFTKSAHIAYMLVARNGDLEGCAPTYRLGQQASDMAVGFDLGVASRIAIANAGSFDVEFWPVVADVAPARLGDKESLAMPIPVGKLLFEDLNSDGYADIAAIDDMGIALVVRFAVPGTGAFLPAAQVMAAQGLRDLVAGDFDDDGFTDIAVVDAATGQLLVLFGDATGEFSDARSVDIFGAPVALSSGDMDSDGKADLVVLSRDDSIVHILFEDGHRDFVAGEVISVGADAPNKVAVLSPNSDGRPDILVAGTQASLFQVVRKPDVVPTISEYSLPRRPEDLVIGDLNGDGLEDALLTTGINSTIFSGFSFVPDLLIGSSIVTQGLPTRAFLADLSGDGDLDIGYAASSWQALRLIQNFGDRLGATTGCGSGEYFLNLNISFAAASDPDPVFTLRSQFDQWNDDRAGRVDAVRSTAVVERGVLDPSPVCQGVLEIAVNDLNGVRIEGLGVADIRVEHADGSDEAASIGAVVETGPGKFQVVLAGTGIDGVDRIRVTVTDPVDGQEVQLMPVVELIVDDLADLDDDGDRDSDDFNIWVTLFTAGDQRADQNRDGVLDFRDFSAWLRNAGLGC